VAFPSREITDAADQSELTEQYHSVKPDDDGRSPGGALIVVVVEDKDLYSSVGGYG